MHMTTCYLWIHWQIRKTQVFKRIKEKHWLQNDPFLVYNSQVDLQLGKFTIKGTEYVILYK